ncbi:hypothetical protein CR513_13315, partial [Mucuna pruriens]
MDHSIAIRNSLLHFVPRLLPPLYLSNGLHNCFYLHNILVILKDHSQDILRLSHESYINKVQDRFNMKDSKLRDNHIAKEDKFSLK